MPFLLISNSEEYEMSLDLPQDTPDDEARRAIKSASNGFRRIGRDLVTAHHLMCRYNIKIDTV